MLVSLIEVATSFFVLPGDGINNIGELRIGARRWLEEKKKVGGDMTGYNYHLRPIHCLPTQHITTIHRFSYGGFLSLYLASNN